MAFNQNHHYRRHGLLKRQGSLQHQHDLLSDKCSSLQDELIIAVDPSVRFKLKHEVKEIQAELAQMELELQQVLEELDRIEQAPSPESSIKPPPPQDSKFPRQRKTNTVLSLPPKHPAAPVKQNSLSSNFIELGIFVTAMAVIWLLVSWGSVISEAQAAKYIFNIFTQRDLAPGISGAIGGCVSGFCSALAWQRTMHYRDKAQTILMGMILGTVSGLIVWIMVWASMRDFFYGFPIRATVFGAGFGIFVSIGLLILLDWASRKD
jgi:hypothetical protein